MPNETENTGQERAGDELLELLGWMAKELSEPAGLQETLQRVVDLAVKALTNCDSASLMLVHRRKIATPAYASQIAYDADQAQYATDEGPCLDAIRDETTIVLNDLEGEERWPSYRQKAIQVGVRSQLSVRLFVFGDTMGALNLYSEATGSFDRRSTTIAQVFAMHASVAMKAVVTETGLRTALQTRDVISQAKGIVMANHKVTADMAFDILRQRSQELNQPVRELAAQIAQTGRLP